MTPEESEMLAGFVRSEMANGEDFVRCSALLELLGGWRRVRDACEQLARDKLAVQPSNALEYFAKSDVWSRAIAGLEAVVAASNSNAPSSAPRPDRDSGTERKHGN